VGWDFAFSDIQKKNLDKPTDYFNELQSELGDEMNTHSNISNRAKKKSLPDCQKSKKCCFILIMG
jgi:hypothetical protein